MDYSVLKNFVDQGFSQYKIADILGCSQSKIRRWLSKYGLKKTVPSPKAITCACGEVDLNKFYKTKKGRIRYRCKKCDNKKTIERFKKYKKESVEYKGGKCFICGYDRCFASLDFHHLDPKEKDLNWRKMRNWPFEKIKVELDKCLLVCKNCHGEIHQGMHGQLAQW